MTDKVLTLNQQADHVELALQSQTAHIRDTLAPKVRAGKRPKEELALAIIHQNGLQQALATLRKAARDDAKTKAEPKKGAVPADLFSAG